MISSLLIATLAVLPADRLAMADRLFNKGKYSEAAAEYIALKDEKSIAQDELLYRFAECDRALGKNESALKLYSEIISRYPHSKHSDRSRFMYAMGIKGAERLRMLSDLDSSSVPLDIRTAALYHLGVDKSDAAILEKCVSLDPKGRYAMYASLRRATILSSSVNAADRRKGIELLLSVAFGAEGEIAEEALYLAAVESYREKRYDEAASLFKRYIKRYANGARKSDVEVMAAWSDYLSGRHAEAFRQCADKQGDDFAYIRAACTYQRGEDDKALELFKKYLDEYPSGKYRADALLPIARIEFKAAEKSGDKISAMESAKRGYEISKLSSDHLRLAWAYENAGKSEEAAGEYLKIARNYPKSQEACEALYRKAMMDAREERWSAAELALAEALSIDKAPSRKALMLYWRGVASIRLGHEEKAMEYLKEALKQNLSPDEAREANLMIADFDLRNGRETEAKATYEKLISEGALERMSASKIFTVGRLVGSENAKKCAKALIGNDQSEWKQAGYILLGEREEAAGSFTSAIDSYRKAMAQTANIAQLAKASLSLGALEARLGEYGKATETLKKAVSLNSGDSSARAKAYVLLAENAFNMGDTESAKAYATVVTALYTDTNLLLRAERIIKAGEKK